MVCDYQVHAVRRSLTLCIFWMSCEILSASKYRGNIILFNSEGYYVDIQPSYKFLMWARLDPPCILDFRDLSQLWSALIISHIEEPFTVIFLSSIICEVEKRHIKIRYKKLFKDILLFFYISLSQNDFEKYRTLHNNVPWGEVIYLN